MSTPPASAPPRTFKPSLLLLLASATLFRACDDSFKEGCKEDEVRDRIRNSTLCRRYADECRWGLKEWWSIFDVKGSDSRISCEAAHKQAVAPKKGNLETLVQVCAISRSRKTTRRSADSEGFAMARTSYSAMDHGKHNRRNQLHQNAIDIWNNLIAVPTRVESTITYNRGKTLPMDIDSLDHRLVASQANIVSEWFGQAFGWTIQSKCRCSSRKDCQQCKRRCDLHCFVSVKTKFTMWVFSPLGGTAPMGRKRKINQRFGWSNLEEIGRSDLMSSAAGRWWHRNARSPIGLAGGQQATAIWTLY